MISDPLRPTPTTTGSQARSARMAMKPAGSIPGYVDGGWWPRSGDLAAEVPELVSALELWVGIVSRVSFHLGTWGTVPRKALVQDRIVRFGGFRSMDPNTVTVIGADSRRVSLLVVPSGVPGGAARAALRSSAGHDSVATVAEILASNGITLGHRPGVAVVPGPRAASAVEQRWEADGGRIRDTD
ncbi:hypothetical protein JD82_04957 [Prauserella rugosa]|uniref:Uncharacterized protein n=2 Tax=Prauserella rugosa TaxID=43354 RepID=A0A660C8J7_9PSEU|nr:hypothetical protein JD82_04957 [Prauserella rugosa]